MQEPSGTPGRWFAVSWPVAALVALALLQLVIAQSVNLFPRIITVDFYQYWGVAAARSMSGPPLGTPYAQPGDYHAVLNQYARAAGHPKLDALGRAASRPGFTATPLTYWLFAAFPVEFTTAATIFHVLQIAAFLAGVVALGLACGYPPLALVYLGCLLVLASGPVSSDLRVGNIGSLQFAALSGCLLLAARLPRAARPRLLGGALLTALTLLLLVKPNVAPAIGMLVLHLWFANGTRVFAASAVPAALVGAAGLVVPCLYFGSWAVWHDWFGFVFGGFGGSFPGIARAPGAGNYSTARIVAAWLGVEIRVAMALILALLLGSMAAVLAARARRAAGVDGRPLRTIAGQVLGDPRLALAIGVTWSLALPPLAWYHYYVVALIPGLWLLTPGPGAPYAALSGLAGLALSLGLPNVVLLPLGWTGAVSIVAALSWLPLWCGVLVRLSSAGDPLAGPVAAPPLPDERRRSEPRRRRARNAALRP